MYACIRKRLTHKSTPKVSVRAGIEKGLLVLLTLSSCLTFMQSAQGLENDKDQLIEIEANSAEFSEETGTAVYKGNVELSQGSIYIQSDSLTIINSEAGVSEVVAVGAPARYQQQMELTKPLIKAKASKIIYYPQDENIVLTGKAQLKQGDKLFQGEKIKYDLKANVLNAEGSITEPGKPTQQNRVKMVIPPVNNPPADTK